MGTRPESIIQDDVDRWEVKRKSVQEAEDYLEVRKSLGMKIPSAEVFYAGEWLGEELNKLNCPSLDINKICFACGQYQSQLNQDWEPAVMMLKRYEKDGTYEEPGDTLAMKLFHMSLGPNPTRKDVIAYVCKNWNIPEEKIDSILVKFMVEGFPKAPDYVTDQKPKVW